MICIYVAVGTKESTVAGVVDNLRRNGAMDYTIVVSPAGKADPGTAAIHRTLFGLCDGRIFHVAGQARLVHL